MSVQKWGPPRAQWRLIKLTTMDSKFFSIFLLSIIAIRFVLYIHPIPAPTICGVRTHHYMYGLIAISVGLGLESLPIFAVGMGLFVDELTFVITGGRTHHDNYSAVSLWGTAVFTGAVFVLRKLLSRPFERWPFSTRPLLARSMASLAHVGHRNGTCALLGLRNRRPPANTLCILPETWPGRRDATTRGKAPCFFIMNGHDLMMILSEAIPLPESLRKRARLLGE
jgi:hypothetical protein